MTERAIYQLETLTDHDRETIRRSWGWFVGLGAALTAVGVVGFVVTGILSLATVILTGWLLVVGGLLTVAHAVLRRRWSGFLYDLVCGCVTALIGGLIVARPVGGLIVITAVIGVMFVLGGILWLVFALTRQSPYGAWTLIHGLTDILLGGMILTGWPVSSEWVLGALVAIELVVTGSRLIALGLASSRRSFDTTAVR